MADKEKELKHLAIVMDGNRRWAKLNNKSVKCGHKAGADKLTEVIDWCIDYKIQYLTVYAFSIENWKRDENEINDIMSLLKEYLSIKKDDFKNKNVKIKVIGIEKNVDMNIINNIREIERETENNTGIQVNIAFNYSGRQEIVDIVKNISKMVIDRKINIENIDEKFISNNLYYGIVPDPDLVIRTGGDIRISNFLLWEIAYSEFYFTDTYWPDFNKELFNNIINNFIKRERRYGGTIKK